MKSKMLTLLPESRLNAIFPNGKVPVLSDFTVSTPKGECFVLDDSLLSDAPARKSCNAFDSKMGN